MSTEALERAIATSRKVIGGVSADDYDKPSPCASWTVGDVVNHIVATAEWAAVSAQSEKAPEFNNSPPDVTGGDVLEAYDRATSAAIAAFGADGVLDKIVSLPWGDMPGSAFMGIFTNDVFVHGWDVAKGTGQSTDLDPEQAAELLEQCHMAISDDIRGPDGEAFFGPATEAPAGATTADQLAAFLGRTV